MSPGDVLLLHRLLLELRLLGKVGGAALTPSWIGLLNTYGNQLDLDPQRKK